MHDLFNGSSVITRYTIWTFIFLFKYFLRKFQYISWKTHLILISFSLKPCNFIVASCLLIIKLIAPFCWSLSYWSVDYRWIVLTYIVLNNKLGTLGKIINKYCFIIALNTTTEPSTMRKLKADNTTIFNTYQTSGKITLTLTDYR